MAQQFLSPTSGMKCMNVPRGTATGLILASGRFPVLATETRGVDSWVQVDVPGTGPVWVLLQSGTRPALGVLTNAVTAGARVIITRYGREEEVMLGQGDSVEIRV